MTTLHTSFGKVRTGSTRPFIAVIKRGEHVARVHARAETRSALEKRLARECFFREVGTGHWLGRTAGVVTARVEVVEVSA